MITSRPSEFSGAVVVVVETPYVKLLAALWRPRDCTNATGCSSIYGANLPTTLGRRMQVGAGQRVTRFEDNAEFGMGFRND